VLLCTLPQECRLKVRDIMAKPSKISGFPEWLPEQKIAEDRVIGAIKRIYESYGFVPIETPAVELLTTLGSKGVIDKEIFAVKRLRAEEGDEAELGLHFDLTVPLARYVAQHAHELSFPFKRYQIQKVWRGDRPQKGRFREFYQFDIDIIGLNDLPLACDAEVLSVVGLVMNEFKVGGYELRINNRKLLAGLYEAIGLSGEARKKAIVAVDKLLKIGAEGVSRELASIPGVNPEMVAKILASTKIRCKAQDLAREVAAIEVQSELIDHGVRELVTICSLLPDTVLNNLVIDLSLARGLDYYTGVIVEVGLLKYPEFGTVISGGRYDDLASEFTDQKLPGVGVSIGLSRFMELLFSENLIDTSKKSPSQVLVTVYSEDDRPHCNRIAHELRSCGVATEVYFKAPKLGKQIEYAEQRGMRYVLFIDSASKAVQVKDIVTKEQRAIEAVLEWGQGLLGLGQ
jgi:histidyl-tRNA synthetase